MYKPHSPPTAAQKGNYILHLQADNWGSKKLSNLPQMLT